MAKREKSNHPRGAEVDTTELNPPVERRFIKVVQVIDEAHLVTKASFTNFFSPVRAHLFVAQKTHLERTGRYFQVDQISNR
jgi:hypothetical protein